MTIRLDDFDQVAVPPWERPADWLEMPDPDTVGITNETLTLDVAPATLWSANDTITGETSGVTCTIVSNDDAGTGLVWTIKNRSGVFTLGEVLTNGTFAADQGAANPTIKDSGRMYLLVPIYENHRNRVYVNCTGAYIINANDGVGDRSVGSNGWADFDLDYANAAFDGSECSRGYKQTIISIRPQAGQNFTAYYRDSIPETLRFALDVLASGQEWTSAPSLNAMSKVERVRIIGCIPKLTALTVASSPELQVFEADTSALTSGANMFSGTGLRVGPSIDTSNMTSVASMFYGCPNLRILPSYNTAKATTFANFADLCVSLGVVGDYDFSEALTVTSMFATATRLKRVQGIFDLPKCTVATSAFGNCFSLEGSITIKFGETCNATSIMPGAGTIGAGLAVFIEGADKANLSSAFTGAMLNSISLDAAPTGATSIVQSVKNGALKDLTLDLTGVTNLTQAFYSARLRSVNLIIDAITNGQNMFGDASIDEIYGSINFAALADIAGGFGGVSLRRLQMSNMPLTFTLANKYFSRSGLLEVFGGLKDFTENLEIDVQPATAWAAGDVITMLFTFSPHLSVLPT